jgi:hypothetical protein
MRPARSVPSRDGFVITEQGRLDLRTAQECNCKPRLSGLLVLCEDCGTVYGSIREGLYQVLSPSRDKR